MAPTARTHRLGEDAAIVDDHARLRLEGNIATFFDGELRPLLTGELTAAEIVARFPNLDPTALDGWLRRLLDAGVIEEVPLRAAGQPEFVGPAAAFYRSLSLDQRAGDRLRTLRIAVIGLNRCGQTVARLLAEAGVGHLVIVDPDADPTTARDRLAGAEITHVSTMPTKDGLAAALHGCDLVLHAWGDAHLASAHWCNQWALATGAKALFCSVAAHRARVGPFVFPGESSCLLCYRMRDIATDDDYQLAITDESWRFEHERLNAPDRAAFPAVVELAAAVATTEMIKVELGFGTPALVDHVWELDPLTLTAAVRPVLQQPQCPACRKKAHPPPAQPGLEALSGAVEPPVDLLALAPRLVDPATGLVTELSEVPRDPSEPALPLVYRAQVANHRFVGKDDEPTTTASGKGMSASSARLSALGEAVERYGAAPWDPARTHRSAAADLDGPYLSPDDLVGYAPEQYHRLPYSRWRPDIEMDWVGARRLTPAPTPAAQGVWVPALGTYLDYQVHQGAEYFYPATSNGLAAGPTLVEAVLGALLELLERDAFLLAWFGRRTGQRVDPIALGEADTIRLARSYARRDVELRLIALPTDTPVHVCAALGLDRAPGPDRPAVVVGLGADLDLARACRKAALEVGQIRPALRARLRDPAVQTRLAELLDDPGKVAELDDHDLLYADPRHLDQLAPWLGAPPVGLSAKPLVPATPGAQLRLLVSALADVGVEVCYVDLTPPDLAALGLSVARVHATGLQPIHFGADEARLGGPRVRALGTDLHLFPHPLA